MNKSQQKKQKKVRKGANKGLLIVLNAEASIYTIILAYRLC